MTRQIAFDTTGKLSPRLLLLASQAQQAAHEMRIAGEHWRSYNQFEWACECETAANELYYRARMFMGVNQ